MTILLLIIMILFSLCGEARAASVIGPAAGALSPGSWTTVPMSNVNLTASVIQPGAWSPASSPGGFYNGPQPAWDSTARKLYIEMSDHDTNSASGDCEALGVLATFPVVSQTCLRPIWKYDDATDVWTVNGLPTNPFPKRNSGTGVSAGHIWGHIAWNDTDKVLYVREFISYDTAQPMWRYCVNATPSYCASQGANTWAQFTGPTGVLHSAGGDASMAWHPGLNKLIYFGALGGGSTGCGALYGYTEGSGANNGTWATIDPGTSCKFAASVNDTAALGNQFMIPSPTKNLVMFAAGGGAPWWSINGAGVITRLDNHPTGCRFGTTNGIIGQGAADPVSGNAYLIGCTATGQMWRLNPTAATGSQWTLIESNLAICTPSRFAPTENCGADFWMTPISSYGVIGAIRFRVGSPYTGEYWIYKASASSGDIIAPTVSITAPSAGATVSGSSVTLSATASDNVGVAGVQFKVDGVATGSEDTVAPFLVIWNTTTASNGSHIITATARDAAGNNTTSTGVTVTVSNTIVSADFTTRCNAAIAAGGRCIPFDAASEIANTAWGSNTGLDIGFNNGKPIPVIDTAIKASGAGSIKFTISSQSPANGAGMYFMNFSTDLSKRYGAGESFYLQWRQRFSPEFLSTNYLPGAGWKTTIITTGDRPGSCTVADEAAGWCQNQLGVGAFSSCQPIDTPTQNINLRGMLQAYNSCSGSTSHGSYAGFTQNYPSGTIDYNGGCFPDCKLQNAMPSPYCLYSQTPAGGGSSPFPPTGGCFGFFADEWMTFKVKVTIGLRGSGTTVGASPNDEFVNSNFKMWIGREGQPSQLVMDHGPFPISAIPVNGDQKFGKIYIGPYQTGKDATQVHAVGYTWYDELIFSPVDIADPSATPDTTIPAVAITSPIPPTTSTTTSPIAVSGTASDNIGVTSVTWTCIQCTIKGGTATSSPGTSISWLIPALNLVSGTNTLNVVAHDAAGNVSTAATLTITYTPRPTRYIDGNLVSNCTGNYSIGNRTCTGTDGDAYTTANAGTATAATVAGDTLYLRSGTYNLRLSSALLTINSGTGDTTRVKIAGYPGETVTLFPSAATSVGVIAVTGKQYVWFDNFVADGTNVTGSESTVTADETSSFIRFSYIESKNNGPVGSDPAFSGAGFLIGGNAHELQHLYGHDNGLNGAACGTAAPYGIYFSAHNSTLENSRFIHNGTYGIHQYHSNSSSTNGNIIRYNEIADNGAARSCGHGLLVSSGSGHQIYGNVIRDQGNGGANVSFDHSQPCINCEFYNNTVVRGTYGGYIEVNSTGLLMKNNIFENNGTNVVNLPGGSTTFAQNLCFGTGGTTGCAITTSDPLFVNYAADDFRLNTGSPALNVGVPLAIVTNSIDGTPRPQGAALDLGAYESSTASLPVVTIVNPTANASLGVTSPIFSLGGTSTLP